ncbi:GTP cyclohydrolase I FolE [Rickettsiales endosymbiont of Trichoplax sp. H2]|uniref:GTP cyclohydrolase I FolE n=1 Tax=Rickettsiales endosymbiont of Trichoplax sp. H2 TaxID=2021221 RepID=UPI0012B32930|nr:GTP cyclohydrolase I FolE [Rickettsiales endosymbiont of Trichoplax sp. H2]MSO13473.1 GTP cyclohydrolase 1 [Rickettsiales endosymbiont of Trichoplax sp. H2]
MQSKLLNNNNIRVKVSDDEAKKAVKTLLEWIGENPDREGLSDTPQRVIDSYKEYFSGYLEDPANILKKTFTETSGYQDMVLLKDINFYSHCEHHIAPIKGVAHIAYYPNTKVVGISKLARIVEIYSKRLQIQERLTSEIANTINYTLKPKGVAVIIEASHSCINNRGINQKLAKMKTHALIGCFRNDPEISRRFFQLIS